MTPDPHGIALTHNILEPLLSANKITPTPLNYNHAETTLYRALINSIWASRDIPLKRYAIAAAEIDESIYNSVETALLCSGYCLTKEGEIQLYKTIATKPRKNIKDILKNLPTTTLTKEDEYYPFKKDPEYKIGLEEITEALNKTQKIFNHTEKIFNYTFQTEKETSQKNVLLAYQNPNKAPLG